MSQRPDGPSRKEGWFPALEGLARHREPLGRPGSSLCTNLSSLNAPAPASLSCLSFPLGPRPLRQALRTQALFWAGQLWCAPQTVAWTCSLRCGTEAGPQGKGSEVAGGTFHPDLPAGSVAEGQGQLFPPRGTSKESDVGPRSTCEAHPRAWVSGGSARLGSALSFNMAALAARAACSLINIIPSWKCHASVALVTLEFSGAAGAGSSASRRGHGRHGELWSVG